MPVLILNTRHTIPEPGKDHKAQRAQRAKIDAAVDRFEADIAAIGGASSFEIFSKKSPGARDLTPPPAPPKNAETDLVTFAELGTLVNEAADGVATISSSAADTYNAGADGVTGAAASHDTASRRAA